MEYVYIVFGGILTLLSGVYLAQKQFAMQKEETGEQGQDSKIDALTDKTSQCVTWTQFDEKELKRMTQCEKEHTNIVEKMDLTFNNHMLKTELLYDKIAEGSENLLKDQSEFKDFVHSSMAAIEQINIDRSEDVRMIRNLYDQFNIIMGEKGP